MILGGKLPGKVGRRRFFGPMVKRLRHGPFTAVTGVRFPVGLPDEPYESAALFISRGCGGTGRHAGFRFLWETVQVQVLSAAPKQKGALCPFLLWKRKDLNLRRRERRENVRRTFEQRAGEATERGAEAVVQRSGR